MAQLSHHTEIEELKDACKVLREQLKETALTMHQMTTQERPRLLALYESAFGDLEATRQKRALEAAEIFRRVELLSIKVSRGETLTPEVIDLINTVVDKEYQKFKQRIKDAFDSSAIGREVEARKKVREADDEELLTMYRSLAKQLHPDAADETEESLAAWHRVQEAYQERNAATLKTLLSAYGTTEATDEWNGWDLDRWQREHRELSARQRLEDRNLQRMKAQEPFVIAKDLENEDWIARHQADLKSDISAREHEINESKKRYEELTGGMIAPGTKVGATKEEQKFEEDFMENTYFGGR